MAQLPLNAPRYIFHWTAAVHVQHIDELSTVAHAQQTINFRAPCDTYAASCGGNVITRDLP